MVLKKNIQFGGNYFITNFHLGSVDLAMAEAITNRTLQQQMTQHGLGTGVYGFIDSSESNKSALDYKLPTYISKQLTISNPLILSTKYKKYGEKRTDLMDLTWFSWHLNGLCEKLLLENKEPSIKNIYSIFSDNHFYPINNNKDYKLTTFLNINISDISYMITFFLLDYMYLSTMTENENYILMPINYILFNLGYDGIYNLNDDTGRTGSVKYFFDGTIARGYRPDMKNRRALDGQLIFLGNKYDRKMIN
jgi:hypothetical protein